MKLLISKSSIGVVGWNYNIGIGIYNGRFFMAINAPKFWSLIRCNFKDLRIINGKLLRLNW